jgi:hypothetical protein
MMRFTTVLFICAASPVFAQSTAQATAQGDIAVTIYNENLALVRDVRQLDVPSGRSRQEFPDVSAQIKAQTVTLGGADIGIVEQNFDYDLLSPDKLMEKAVGQTITIVRTNPATGAETREQAKVLAANGGIVLQIGNRIEVLRDDDLPVRVIFDKVPDNLRARPTLSVTIESGKSGVRPVSLTYLTPGLGWNADYVALFDEGAGKIDVQGWVTLTNRTGTSFTNAKTLLVAGDVNQTNNQNNEGDYRYQQQPRNNIRRAGTQTANREQLGDYYVYPLKERTTIANAQTKQVSFLDVAGATARKAYEYRVGWLQTIPEPQSFATVLKFSSSAQGGLGDALPAGTVRVYMKDARGNPQFIGENNIGHTPMGSDLALKTGDAFDVKLKTTVDKRERLSAYRWRTTMSYTLTNARAEKITADLVQGGLDWVWMDTKIISENQKSTRVNSDGAEWKVSVPANGTATVTAVFETKW